MWSQNDAAKLLEAFEIWAMIARTVMTKSEIERYACLQSCSTLECLVQHKMYKCICKVSSFLPLPLYLVFWILYSHVC